MTQRSTARHDSGPIAGSSAQASPCGGCLDECGPDCPCPCHTPQSTPPAEDAEFALALNGLITRGLVDVDEDGRLELTPRGRYEQVAAAIDPWLADRSDVER